MLFMEDSDRAAARAKEHPQLGIGLHLNLVEEYSDPEDATGGEGSSASADRVFPPAATATLGL